VPLIPDPLTWGDSLELNERLLTALQKCNNDKSALRDIERFRVAFNESTHLKCSVK